MPTPDDIFAYKLDDDSSKPRFRQIQDYVLAQVANGKLKPGAKLPPLRQWAGEVGVAYETMSKAIRELVDRGVLEARPRWGTRVASRGAATNRRTGAVGIVTAAPYQHFLLSSRFYGALLPILQDELMKLHERVIFERSTETTSLAELFDDLKLVDGLILTGNNAYDIDEVRAVEALGVPVVFAGGEMEQEDLFFVRTDDVADCREIARQLVSAGYTTVAAWMDIDDPRERGLREGLAEAGVAPESALVFTDRQPGTLAARIAELPGRPIAMLIARHLDRAAQFVADLAAEGLRLGEDVYICQYDEDLWHNMGALGIPYARIEQPLQEIARTCADVLLARIEGTYKGPNHTLLRSRYVTKPGR